MNDGHPTVEQSLKIQVTDIVLCNSIKSLMHLLNDISMVKIYYLFTNTNSIYFSTTVPSLHYIELILVSLIEI